MLTKLSEKTKTQNCSQAGTCVCVHVCVLCTVKLRGDGLEEENMPNRVVFLDSGFSLLFLSLLCTFLYFQVFLKKIHYFYSLKKDAYLMQLFSHFNWKILNQTNI